MKKKNLEETIANFNPDENGLTHHGIFGLPFGVDESKVVLVPVPWEATVSYKEGTVDGPKAILDASQQIDLYDPINPNGWKEGIAMADIPSNIYFNSKQVREKTSKYLDKYVDNEIDFELQKQINADCLDLKNYVKGITEKYLKEDKIVGVVGGDHSVALGFLEALAGRHKEFGILQIDAHADLREAYEGLEYSHASIFFNALKIKNIKKLVQVGVRDISPVETELIKKEKDRISTFTDYEIRKSIFEGKSWAKKCDEIIKKLPKEVYISFDIDGLQPNLCPNTGTPVPGGFTIEELVFLFEKIVSAKKKIIGFDLNEVAPSKDINDQWDGNVGARVLYKLCLLTLKSQK
jgi:agmatinase